MSPWPLLLWKFSYFRTVSEGDFRQQRRWAISLFASWLTACWTRKMLNTSRLSCFCRGRSHAFETLLVARLHVKCAWNVHWKKAIEKKKQLYLHVCCCNWFFPSVAWWDTTIFLAYITSFIVFLRDKVFLVQWKINETSQSHYWNAAFETKLRPSRPCAFSER